MRITKRTLDTISTDDPAGRHVCDDEMRGFGITVLRTGRILFWVRYSRGPKRRRVTFGEYGKMTLKDAREKAAELLAQARLSKLGQAEDPAILRERAEAVPTWEAWTTDYATEVRKRKKSAAQDLRFLGLAEESGERYRNLRRKWANRTLDEIRPEDVRTFHDSLAEVRIEANRWLASVRAALSEALRRGHVAANAAASVTPYPENPARARILSDEERTRLCAAIEQEKDVHAKAALMLLILTGARRSEVLRAKWADIDFEAGLWRIPSPKAGTPQVVPLRADALAILKKLPQDGVFVIRGRSRFKPRADLNGPWSRALEAAELTEADITIHDLRRDFGAFIARTAGLHAAQGLLRHSDPRITAKVYAPHQLEDLRRAAEARTLPLPSLRKKTTRHRAR